MTDGMYTLTTDDLTCNNKHNSYTVYSQCTSNSTASQWYLVLVCHESWDIAKQ